MSEPRQRATPASASGPLDLQRQAAERPWLIIGAAVAAGYALGRMGEREPAERGGVPEWARPDAEGRPIPSAPTSWPQTQVPPQAQASAPAKPDALAPLWDEIAMLRSAAITTVRSLLRATVRDYLPARRSADAATSSQPTRL